MNLIHEQWIPVIRNGRQEKIAPWQISEPDISDITGPRPDFKGALFQFCIGLLQTASPPDDIDSWLEWWENPPDSQELKQTFETISKAFEFETDGPAFMQDYDLPDGETKAVSALLIEAPGGKTEKDNLDHFIKRGLVKAICPHCAATALFTLQTNAPSGGVGHRVGLRGGGPLTTLVLPDEKQENITLWQRLWLNILPREDTVKLYETNCKSEADIFPWMAPTRTSEKKTGQDTYPEDAHPLQMYWGMPRRIRMNFSDTVSGVCDLCGESGEQLVTHFRMKNYGVNYNGAWVHPLSPHNLDPKDQKPPLPVHGQKGGITYRHWLGLVLDDKNNNTKPSLTVYHYDEKNDKKNEEIEGNREVRVWAFGYDLDNMKARCWYESVMPVYPFPPKQRETVARHANEFINTAEKIAYSTRTAVKKAWFSRTKDVKGDFSFIDKSFWQDTETGFYKSLRSVIDSLEDDTKVSEIREQWGNELRAKAMSLFDEWALSCQAEDRDMERIILARQELFKWVSVERKKLIDKN